MDAFPSPRLTARNILIIAVSSFGVGPGEPLPILDVSIGWHQRHRRAEDFDAGLQYAVAHGWIESLPGDCGYRLTAAGFDAA